jgi:hypothetical protein
MEALLVSYLGKPVHSISPQDYSEMLDRIGFLPRILNFAPKKAENQKSAQGGR